MVIDRPIASAAVYPNICAAARFHEVMIPSRSWLTMASLDDSTIAARCKAALGGVGVMQHDYIRPSGEQPQPCFTRLDCLSSLASAKIAT